MQKFINFSQHVPLLIDLAIETAAIIGLLFIFRALVKLKIYGEMRSMMAPHARINQILLLLFTGALLVYLPSTKPLLTDIFLGMPVIPELSYGRHAQNLNEEIQNTAKWIMSLIGHIALIRGIVQLGTYQEGGRHTLSKSMTHIIAGVCAINIQPTLDLLNSLVGVD